MERNEIRKIAFIGDYVPRRCGIATYTYDLRHAIANLNPEYDSIVVAVDDIEGGYDYPAEVRFEIPERELVAYRRAADFLNYNQFDIVCLQHEFGIYGGAAGGHILALLRKLRMPIVTTLHTVLETPHADQRRVMERIIMRSTRLMVMSEKGKLFLRDIYSCPEEKIDVIPHGIPDMSFVDPNFFKDQFDVEGKHVLLTFGLLSPNKGIEYVLQALPHVLREFPDTVYIVLGATHPNLLRDQGDSYRLRLERMTHDLQLQDHVVFYDRFVELNELTEFLGAADLYVTPYLNPAQITSGTLAYAFGCGKAVISTPYWHAEELLADGRGVLVPFADSASIGREICNLLQNESQRHAMRKRAYLMGREMIWSRVGEMLMESFDKARRSFGTSASMRPSTKANEADRLPLPALRLDHLMNMTDSTGIFQHATYTIPNFREGYCTDDNARALILTVLLQELGEDSTEVQRAATAYAGFLQYSSDPVNHTWRNFLSFDRRWLEELGSEDALGRKIWALGTCVGRSKRRDLQFWAIELFEYAVRSIVETSSPRAWSLALLGIHEYLRRLSGDRLVNQIRDDLTDRLLKQYQDYSSTDWCWFEDIVAYDNARIPHALILSGRWSGNDAALQVGLDTLQWLIDIQHSPSGCFRPIGTNGFYLRGGEPAAFDQQPIEAGALVSACIEAYRTTTHKIWLDHARWAFEWFLGRNDLGLPLYDARSGGCCDGLHEDRINQNQGAESTLAWLLALAELKLLQETIDTYDTDLPPEIVVPHPLKESSPKRKLEEKETVL